MNKSFLNLDRLIAAFISAKRRLPLDADRTREICASITNIRSMNKRKSEVALSNVWNKKLVNPED
jgi:hypothetical protein